MTPAGTSNELDVQNKWGKHTHTTLQAPINIMLNSIEEEIDELGFACPFVFLSSADHEQDCPSRPKSISIVSIVSRLVMTVAWADRQNSKTCGGDFYANRPLNDPPHTREESVEIKIWTHLDLLSIP